MSGGAAHLSEAERQMLIDDSVTARRRQELETHLRDCVTCASDVARLRQVARRFSGTETAEPSFQAVWPAIRSRIEQHKVAALDPASGRTRRRVTLGHSGAVAAGLVAVGLVGALLMRGPGRRPAEGPPPDSLGALIAVADSSQAYEAEARALLDRFELQRAMLRPEARTSIDRDLAVIDQAIAELKAAIARDPANTALRPLLAASYRQKIELLKRAGNAS